MFKTLQRGPTSGLCSYNVSHSRLAALSTLCGEGSGAAAWLGRRVGSVLSWLQKGAGEGRGKGMIAIIANQCSFVTGQRLRRAYQIGELYGSLYSERSRRSLMGSLWRRFQGRSSRTGKLVAALAGVFMWEEEKIRDDELQRCASEMQNVELLSRLSAEGWQKDHHQGYEQGWEVVMDRKGFYVWRKPIPDSHLYEYRVLGTYTDVTPRQFFNVQLDTEYRKKWDALVIKLEVIDRDEITGSEVVHWVTHFPYPMYSRDYVYVRRYSVDLENNLMILVSRTVEHPTVPETADFVRVRSYQSKMVIRPHKSFDENGFDYLLTYSDDPQTVFPRYCVSWMVSSGMPDFLEKLHKATLRAKNMEMEVRDYLSAKPSEIKPPPSSERLGDTSRTGQQGQGHMEYA
ncbi:stAR-related lipid transfer protein 7, mitochondrial [Lepisosteus oculatus]|uniref:StAR-related lipid transfer protein 7, mitochondrial n=1 Tax=Lepisosteus oculatus TaxID=7918 RepID=W5NDK5_LEPOC|nr:PREDICTED: stAR-related lipid transfer protein 7, mitochondrial [Lepisosteus oculatus]XP_015198232.1 PREDICTED: stAR-related lipid transfer protein 7, mitochondrial [Lepisosteus oculatus]